MAKKYSTDYLIDLIKLIDHMAALGLGSKDPKHWEAALEDILNETRPFSSDGDRR